MNKPLQIQHTEYRTIDWSAKLEVIAKLQEHIQECSNAGYVIELDNDTLHALLAGVASLMRDLERELNNLPDTLVAKNHVQAIGA